MEGPPSKEAGLVIRQEAYALWHGIERGDMMIGILSLEEARRIPQAFAKAAEFGVDVAWLDLASWLSDPPIDEPDFAGAEEVLRKAVEADVFGAKIRLAEQCWYYQRESASDEAQRETYEILQELVEEDPDDDEALYLLGLITAQGFGTDEDPAKAVELLQRAAELDNADAMFELYIHYATGRGVEQDERLAFDAISKAADANHPRAMYNMGAFYATGRYVDEDAVKAAEWYRRSWDAGNPQAAASLAVLYAMGNGVEKDPDHARDLFEQADYLGVDVSRMREIVGV